jgi:signal transduction histidine kinase
MIDDEDVAVIAKNLDRMEAIIEDVLTLAREGRSVEETETVDLEVLVQNCWAQVETAAASLTTDAGLTIEADPNRCQQMLENLMRNSIEHVGDDVSIHVGHLPNGFYVEDDGPGIDPENREAVFEPGYTTNREGTGLGLNIVKESAEAHGWDVQITEGSERGARFEFTGGTLATAS